MNAITFQGVGDVRAETVADPKIVDATDVVVRITTSAVCGSDLHQYHGRGGGALVQKGAIMGHEFMGVVDEVGAAVRTVRAGDRVVLPFTHTMALGDAPRGYAIFDKKEDRAIKVMLKP